MRTQRGHVEVTDHDGAARVPRRARDGASLDELGQVDVRPREQIVDQRFCNASWRLPKIIIEIRIVPKSSQEVRDGLFSSSSVNRHQFRVRSNTSERNGLRPA